MSRTSLHRTSLTWTSPSDLREQVNKLWERGDLLVSELASFEGKDHGIYGDVFPKRLLLKCPSATELRDRFDEARSWSKKLQEMPHLRLERREFNHRTLGVNSVPASAWLDNIEAAAALVNRQKDLKNFRALVIQTKAQELSLLSWIGTRPIKALSLAADWPMLLKVVAWMKAHPNPNVYFRQIDVPGVHSKFIEDQRAVLSELIELAAPACVVDPLARGQSGFARRHGFREKPERVRFRVLDNSLHLLQGMANQDIELDAGTFARLDLKVSRVFITENEVNFLSFPQVPSSMVIFGAGYGFSALREASWLHNCEIYYWGDIDTHGFAILNELRARFTHVNSLLMDRATLMQFRDLWGHESSPVHADLSNLTQDESQLYDDLRDNVFGEAVRFEQERVSFSWVLAALRYL